MNIFPLSKLSRLLLVYGIFTVLCHSAMIMLLSSFGNCVDGTICAWHGVEILEHSLMSFCRILTGALAVEYLSLRSE